MISNPKSHWWYRLSQVLYSIFVIFLIIMGITAIFTVFPRFSSYQSTYQLRCFSGETRGSFSGKELNYSDTDLQDESARKMARFACSRPDLTGETFTDAYKDAIELESVTKNYIPVGQRTNVQESEIPKSKNYSIELNHKGYDGRWWYPIIAFAVSAVIIPLVSSLIRAIFLYIVLGSPFWSTLMLKRNKTIQTPN